MKKIIYNQEKKQRIDKFLSKKLNISRTIIADNIKNENILVNEKIIKPSFKLQKSDIIYIKNNILLDKDITIKPANIKLNIIYEDKNIIVINKQRGLVVHPAPGNWDNTLVNALIYLKKQLAKTDDIKRPGIVHRLDKDTSGVMVIAKNYKSLINLQNQWKEKKVEKIYLAITYNNFKEKKGKIEIPLFKTNKKTKISLGFGKYAITYFQLLKNYNNFALIKLNIKTGRTHQIRSHLKYINHPILGDSIYYKNCKDIKLALHSFSLSFYLPDTNIYKTFKAPLPKDFKNILQKLIKGDKIC